MGFFATRHSVREALTEGSLFQFNLEFERAPDGAQDHGVDSFAKVAGEGGMVYSDRVAVNNRAKLAPAVSNKK